MYTLLIKQEEVDAPEEVEVKQEKESKLDKRIQVIMNDRSICLFVCHSLNLSVYLSICMNVYLFICSCLQELIELICNVQAMEEAVKEMKYDTKKAPLGILPPPPPPPPSPPPPPPPLPPPPHVHPSLDR